VFASVAQSGRRALAGHNLLLSHSPYSNSAELDDSHHRYDQWRLPRLGAWLLHGHTHSSTRRGDHTIHVGLDAWVNSSPLGRPVRSRDASCIR
jgi:calcineurin-like phosphoesterase family protein